MLPTADSSMHSPNWLSDARAMAFMSGTSAAKLPQNTPTEASAAKGARETWAAFSTDILPLFFAAPPGIIC